VKIPLLKSKILLPPILTNHLARPRLVDKLNHGLGSRLILLSAPAGYGKTTLLSAWATGSGLPVAWLTLDSGDNDLSRFFKYFIAAHTTIAPGRSQEKNKSLETLASNQSLSPDEWVSIVIELLEEFPGEFIFIMEDYQAITDLLIHQAVDFLLDHKPPQMHVAIATRVDPPLSLAKLRARGELTELRQADLRFTTEEAQAFITRWLGGEMTAEDNARLFNRTEGWVAGLQMACLALRGASFSNHEELAQRVSDFSGSHEYIVDFFAAEVLPRRAEQERSFLLQTSILDQLCAGLCNDVTGGTGGQDMLERLQKANLFIIPLDQQRQWYRYHHLFSDLLRKQFQQEMPERVSELHLRASRWYEANGLLEPAFQHACFSGDMSHIDGIFDRHAEPLWKMGEYSLLDRLITYLSEEQLVHHPELGVARAMTLCDQGEYSKAETLLRNVRQGTVERMETFPSDPIASDFDIYVHPERILGLVNVADAHIAYYRGNYNRVIDSAHQALDLLQRFHLRQDIPWRCEVLVSLGSAYWSTGDSAAGTQALGEAMVLAKSYGHHHLLMLAAASQALFNLLQGKVDQALQSCQEGISYANQRGLTGSPIAARLLAVQGMTFLKQGSLELAGSVLQETLVISRRGDDDMAHCLVALALNQYWNESGCPDKAEVCLQEAQSLVAQQKITPWVAAVLSQAFPDKTTLFFTGRNPVHDVFEKKISRSSANALAEPLSERECEVLRLMAEGLSNRQIAGRLYLSIRTVKFHTGNIYQKLGVERRTEAIARARALGLLS
jgi:LuxR family maltose regulon positive regulatory protein